MSRQVVANASSRVAKRANGASEEFASLNTNVTQPISERPMHEATVS